MFTQKIKYDISLDTELVVVIQEGKSKTGNPVKVKGTIKVNGVFHYSSHEILYTNSNYVEKYNKLMKRITEKIDLFMFNRGENLL